MVAGSRICIWTGITFRSTAPVAHCAACLLGRAIERSKPRHVVLPITSEGRPLPHSPRLFPFLEAAFEDGVHAQLLMDLKRTLVRANRQARELLSIVPSDVGRPLRDPDISFHSAEFWGSIEEAFRRHRPVRLANVECPRPYGVLRRYRSRRY